MRPPARPHAPTYLVVIRNTVVAEDLRELLFGWGAARVDVLRDWLHPLNRAYSVVFLRISPDDPDAAARIAELRAAGSRIVCLTHATPEAVPEDGLTYLEEPFRSEDVAAALLRLGIDVPAVS